MKFSGTKNLINCTVFVLGALCALSSVKVIAGTMGPAQIPAPGKIYFGVFGGGGSSNHVNTIQYGTAYLTEANGGPLAVNAFGSSNSRSVGIVGGQVGFQWSELFLNSLTTQWSLSPAVEFEGYYMEKSSLIGHDINNETVRLTEHDFLVTYPLSTGVFLANAVLNFNSTTYPRWHPYAGAGLGAAVLSITDADSLQVSPAEPGLNHYNGNTDDTVAAFAGQAKVGLNFDLTSYASLFAEYRWLYIANSKFTFGSTMYPLHVATSTWDVNLGAQYYNMGSAGIRVVV